MNKILAGINDKETLLVVLKDSAVANKNAKSALPHLDESSQKKHQSNRRNLNETISKTPKMENLK